MQKKILALAIAGLVSGCAFAQSSVTVYGAVDISDVYASDNFVSSTKSMNAVQSGAASLNGSRIGFKGTEDLGDGLSANFRMEGGFNLDAGTSAQGGALFGRWSTVGLTSNTYGTIEGGRRDTFHDQLLVAASGNGRNTIAQNSSVYLDQNRINNFIAYLSPIWNGLQVKLGYSSNGTNESSTTVNTQDVVPVPVDAASATTNSSATNSNLRVYSAALHYQNGPLLLGAAYDYNAPQDRSSTDGSGDYKSGNVWNVAGAYDFGVVRLDAAYGVINYAANSGNASVGTGAASGAENKDKREQWAVGAVVPFGTNDRVMFNYAHATIKWLNSSWADNKIALWGANYMHDLSKRTTLYASFAKINQDDTFSDGGTKNIASLSGTGTGYQQGVQVGIRHFF